MQRNVYTDPEHKRNCCSIYRNMIKRLYRANMQYSNLPAAKKKAGAIKTKVIENLEKYLIEFELNFKKNGGKVIWAKDAESAMKEITEILKKANAKTIVKAKSMVTEEVQVNHILEKNHMESLETDLGEVIQQMDGEPPYHIVTPAMHKSKEDVAKLFHEKKGYTHRLDASANNSLCKANASREIPYCRCRYYRS